MSRWNDWVCLVKYRSFAHRFQTDNLCRAPAASTFPPVIHSKWCTTYASPPSFWRSNTEMLWGCSLEAGFLHDSVVLEGMFLINTSPLVTHCTMKDYAQFIIRKFAVTHQVHIVFDSPGQNPHTPKTFEHSCRNAEHAVSPQHDHFHFTDTAAVPQKSRDYLNCFPYKRHPLGYLCEAFSATPLNSFQECKG